MPVTRRRVSERYAKLSTLVIRTAAGFARTHGGEYDEIYADACLLFVHACGRRPPPGKTFRQHARRVMWNGLLSRWRTEVRRARLRVPLEDVPGPVPDGSLGDAIDEMSEDAKKVVFLALYPPVDVSFGVNERGGKHSPRNWRSAIVEYLTTAGGWPRARVRAAVEEVRNAFS